MGCFRPKVREEPAGNTAAWRLIRKCAVMTPTPMPVPTMAPMGPPKYAPVRAPAPPATAYWVASVLGLSLVRIVPSPLTLVRVERSGLAGYGAQVVVRAIRQHHFIGQQAQRAVTGDAAAVVRVGHAAVDHRAGGNDDAALLHDILIDLRGEDACRRRFHARRSRCPGGCGWRCLRRVRCPEAARWRRCRGQDRRGGAGSCLACLETGRLRRCAGLVGDRHFDDAVVGIFNRRRVRGRWGLLHGRGGRRVELAEQLRA